MLWESVIGIAVFTALVLWFGPEWWSSSLGTLKEQERKKKQQQQQNAPKSGE